MLNILIPMLKIFWIFLLFAHSMGLNPPDRDDITYIFHPDYCSMKCNGKTHTLCNEEHLQNVSCAKVETRISDAQRKKMKRMLVMGHNGLRNRIAERMNVANMVEMVWHDELALMAEKYIFKCKPYETDPCALLSYLKNQDPYLFVAQNRYIQQNTHYPNILIENALRTWYLERDTMSSPNYTFSRILQTNIGKLKNENNFSHLASPVTYHIGCGIGRFESGYILICNYHPFVRTSAQETEFLSGLPGSLCPITQPMRNSKESFANICIGAERNATSLVKFHFIIAVIIFCTYLKSIIGYT